MSAHSKGPTGNQTLPKGYLSTLPPDYQNILIDAQQSSIFINPTSFSSSFKSLEFNHSNSTLGMSRWFYETVSQRILDKMATEGPYANREPVIFQELFGTGKSLFLQFMIHEAQVKNLKSTRILYFPSPGTLFLIYHDGSQPINSWREVVVSRPDVLTQGLNVAVSDLHALILLNDVEQGIDLTTKTHCQIVATLPNRIPAHLSDEALGRFLTKRTHFPHLSGQEFRDLSLLRLSKWGNLTRLPRYLFNLADLVFFSSNDTINSFAQQTFLTIIKRNVTKYWLNQQDTIEINRAIALMYLVAHPELISQIPDLTTITHMQNGSTRESHFAQVADMVQKKNLAKLIVEDRLIVPIPLKQPLDFEKYREHVLMNMLKDLVKTEEDGLKMRPLLATFQPIPFGIPFFDFIRMHALLDHTNGLHHAHSDVGFSHFLVSFSDLCEVGVSSKLEHWYAHRRVDIFGPTFSIAVNEYDTLVGHLRILANLVQNESIQSPTASALIEQLASSQNLQANCIVPPIKTYIVKGGKFAGDCLAPLNYTLTIPPESPHPDVGTPPSNLFVIPNSLETVPTMPIWERKDQFPIYPPEKSIGFVWTPQGPKQEQRVRTKQGAIRPPHAHREDKKNEKGEEHPVEPEPPKMDLFEEPGMLKDEPISQKPTTPPAPKPAEQLPVPPKPPTLKGKAGKTAKQVATEPIPEKLVEPKVETKEEEKKEKKEVKTEEQPKEAPVAAPVERKEETKPVQKAKAKAAPKPKPEPKVTPKQESVNVPTSEPAAAVRQKEAEVVQKGKEEKKEEEKPKVEEKVEEKAILKEEAEIKATQPAKTVPAEVPTPATEVQKGEEEKEKKTEIKTESEPPSNRPRRGGKPVVDGTGDHVEEVAERLTQFEAVLAAVGKKQHTLLTRLRLTMDSLEEKVRSDLRTVAKIESEPQENRKIEQGKEGLSKLKARGYLLLSRIGYAKGNLEDAYFNVLISLQEMEMKENVLWNEELSQQIEVGGEEAVEEEIPDQPEKQKRGDTNTEGGKRQKREKKK